MYESDPCKALDDTERLVAAFENENEGSAGPLPDAARILAERFPELLFKFQELGDDGVIRVRPEFTTPVIRGALAGTEIVDGRPSLLNSEITFDASPEMRTGILAEDPLEVVDPESIRRYVRAHFSEEFDSDFAEKVIRRFGIVAVYFFPVRKHGSPFGVITISSPRRLNGAEQRLWRLTARMIGLTCVRRTLRRLLELNTQVVALLSVPIAVLDEVGTVKVASRRLHSLLDETDPLKIRRDIARCHAAWTQRKTGAETVSVVLGRKMSIPVTIREEAIHNSDGVLLGYAVRFFAEKSDDESDALHLSERELEILRYVAEGYSNKEIATALERSIHTVQFHRSALRKKLRPQDSGLTFPQLAALIVAGRR